MTECKPSAKPLPVTSQMSTLALAPCTLIFTGADLASVHDQIAKYCVEKGLADAVEEAPAPAPVAPALFPYENGLVKEFTDGELLRMIDYKHWPELWVRYANLKSFGNSKPAEIAKVARELAASHFPSQQELAGEYIYLRFLMGASSKFWHLSHELGVELRKQGSTLRPNDFLVPVFPGDYYFLSMGEVEQLLHQVAAKLVKAGWKSHRNGNFAGTEFQRLAIICGKHPINEELTAGYTLRANKLDEELVKLH